MGTIRVGGHVGHGKKTKEMSHAGRDKLSGHAKNMADYPHLTFTDSPEFDSIYYNWNNIISPLAEKNVSEEFLISKVMIDQISAKRSLQLLRSLRSGGHREYSIGDCSEDYVASCMKLSEEAVWKTHLPFFDLKKEQLQLIKGIIEELRPFVEKYIGPFKLINTKASETRNTMGSVGPNSWHTDSKYPRETHKVFVYMNGSSPTLGTTKFNTKDKKRGVKGSLTVEGPPGTFVLFNPVKTTHCGVRPAQATRPMMEFIMVPWHETIIEPTFNGTNSTHPIDPYH